MRNKYNQLGDILNATDAQERQRAVKIALKNSDDLDASALNQYSLEFGPWVEEIPILENGKKKQRKKGKKLRKSLINILATKNRISMEKGDELIAAVNNCKSIDELKALHDGKTHHRFKYKDKIYNITTPDLNKRAKKAKLPPQTLSVVYKNRETYLKKKQRADRLALGLNAVVSIFGIGLLGAIATMAILPLMPLAAFIPTLVVFALLGGYVEGFVYHGYVQKFCRNLVRGFFESIENNLLNRVHGKQKWLTMSADEQKAFLKSNHVDRMTEVLYRNLGRKQWLSLSKEERKDTLAQHRKELITKKFLAVAIMPIGMASGVGFASLLFTQFAGLLTFFGIVSGIAAVAAPWALAVVVGPIYGMIMYSMIHNAIKNNVFLQMRDNARALFKRKEGQSTAAYVGLCILKSLGFLAVLAISVTATVFSAGAWLEGSVGFFSAAVGLVDSVATKIGWAIGAVFLGTGLWFSIEKSLDTAKELMNLSFKGIKHMFSSPKRFFSSLLDSIPLAVHFVATGATDALGTEVVLNIPPSTHAKLAVTAIGIAEEALVDVKDYGDGHSHDHAGHSHGGLSGHLGSLCKSVASLFSCKKKREEVDMQISPKLKSR